MKKEEVEKLFDMLDNVFNNINSKNKSTGTGLHFGYKLLRKIIRMAVVKSPKNTKRKNL